DDRSRDDSRRDSDGHRPYGRRRAERSAGSRRHRRPRFRHLRVSFPGAGGLRSRPQSLSPRKERQRARKHGRPQETQGTRPTNVMNPLKLLSIALLVALHTALAQEVPTVRTATPAKASEATIYEIPGRTEPVDSATIFTRATGIIRERRFEIGDVVKSDDALAIVAAPEIDRAVEAARANVEQAIARATNARSLSNRSSRLLKSDVVTEEESEQRQTAAV